MMLFPDNWFGKIMPLIDDRGFTIVGSISQMDRIPNNQDMSKLILYNWDVYPWHNRTTGEWKRWGKLMADCFDIWHPSMVTFRRTEQFYGISKGQVVKTFCPVDWVDGETSRNGSVLMPMRDYPKDECFDWVDRACSELGINLIRPRAKMPKAEYIKVMQNCSLILSPYAEASTGGLGMIEGHFLGKPVLANTSVYSGAREYMETHAKYFDTFEDLKDKLTTMLNSKEQSLAVNRLWVQNNYDIEVMAKKINEIISSYK